MKPPGRNCTLLQMLNKGQKVRNTKEPSWGTGRVLEMMPHDKVRVLFADGKARILNLRFVALEIVETESLSSTDHGSALLAPLPQVDIGKVRSICALFISTMENRRSSHDDAGVARLVIEEMEKRGRLTLATYKRLAKWCHTGGSFQEGTDMAQDLSREIYGRVISRNVF